MGGAWEAYEALRSLGLWELREFVVGVPGNIDPASETCGFEISPKALEAQ